MALELVFKITPPSPAPNELERPIISGIAQITHPYKMNFLYWNGREYIEDFSFISSDIHATDISEYVFDIDLYCILTDLNFNKQYHKMDYKEYLLEIFRT